MVTALHFVIVFGYTALNRKLTGVDWAAAGLRIIYEDGQAVLRDILASATAQDWSITSLTTDDGTVSDTALTLIERDEPPPRRLVTVKLQLSGPRATNAATALSEVAGVVHVEQRQDDED